MKLSEWMIQNIRFTLFPKTGYLEDPSKLWPKTQAFSLQKQTTDKITGQSIIEGEFNSNKIFSLMASPLRIDFNFLPKNVFDMSNVKLPILGSLEKTIVETEIFKKQFVSMPIPEPIRIALGMNLFFQVNSTNKGYDLLTPYLPFKLDHKKYRDFSYQINSPTISKVIKSLSVNRLIRLNVLRFKVGVNSIDDPKKTAEYPEQYYVHLELDINTDKENKQAIKLSILPKLFEELIDISKQTSTVKL